MSRGAGAIVTRWATSSPIARGARSLRQGAPPAAGRRCRTSVMTPLTAMRGLTSRRCRCGAQSRPGDRDRYLDHRRGTHRLSGSSAICSTSRGSRAACTGMTHEDVPVARAVRPRPVAARARTDDEIDQVRERDRTGARPPTAIPIASTGAAEPGRQRAAHTPTAARSRSRRTWPRQLRLRVRNSGEGIHPDHLPLLFDRFYKTDAPAKHQWQRVGAVDRESDRRAPRRIDLGGNEGGAGVRDTPAA